MSKLTEKLCAVKCVNQYDFYGDQPYLAYQKYQGRVTTSAGWRVHKRGVSLDDAWYNYGAKVFHGNMRSDALATAQAWASQKFKVKEWARDPWGGYGPADYVRARLKALVSVAEPTGAQWIATHVFVLLDGTEIPVQVERRGDPVACEEDNTNWHTVCGPLENWWTCSSRGVDKIRAVRVVSERGDK